MEQKRENVIYNVIYLLKYSKVGPITCIVCHANWLISGFKVRSTFVSRCPIQSIFRSAAWTRTQKKKDGIAN